MTLTSRSAPRSGSTIALLGWFFVEWVPCITYVFLYVVLDIMIASEGKEDELTGRRKYNYTPGALIILAEGGKLVFSLIAAFYENAQASKYDKRKRSSSVSYTEPAVVEYDVEDEDIVVTRQRSSRSSIGQEDEAPETLMEYHYIRFNLSRGIWYLIPAILYTSWNYINYQSILHVPLSVYSIIYQSVLFFTALLWSIAFNRRLTLVQWFALILLAAGVFLVHLKSNFEFHFTVSIMWVLAQAGVSAIASVYNEVLYKRPSDYKISINEQNTYLYFFTTICTGIYLLASEGPELFKPDNFFRGFTPTVWAIVGVTILLGLSVSMILKHRNVIVKLYAQAIHSPMEVVGAHLILHTDLTWMIALASVLIALSTYLYYRPQNTAAVVIARSDSHRWDDADFDDNPEERVGLTTQHPSLYGRKRQHANSQAWWQYS